MSYILLNPSNIADEHICCAISDKKCVDGYEQKKDWLRKEFANGYVFLRHTDRAKVFIEYGPAEKAWVPVTAPNHLMLGCFWISGQYKGKGHGKALLQEAIADARKQKKAGLVAVVGTKKYHFMSDTKWLLKHGFEVCDTTPAGFSLLRLTLDAKSETPRFNKAAKTGECAEKKGYVAYYSARCPFTDFHIHNSLAETARKRNLVIKIIKLETIKQAQASPTPATIFSLFHDGRFVTTDLSVCMDSRFDRIAGG